MLNSNSIVRSPPIIEKSVRVKVLKPIYVAGQECAVGSIVSMALSDGQALQTSRPPTVEIIK